MPQDQFSEIDNWTSEDVSLFKERARSKKREIIQSLTTKKEMIQNLLVAEGDSWFDYLPGADIIDWLHNDHNYAIDNYAKAGDTLENMIYGTAINKHFERESPTINIVLRRIGELKPKVFLFSGGGNDIAGEEFEAYLNHKDSGLPVLRQQYIDYMITNVFRQYFVRLIDEVAIVAPLTHIVVHGYGHTVPTGKGVGVLFFTFAGPWLKPALAKKGIFDVTDQRNAVFTMIDKYNEMLKTLSQVHNKFHHVDLREIINPEKDWDNELHLCNSAFKRVAQKIHEVIQSI